MPSKMVEQVAFSANFVTVVGVDAQVYGLTPQQMTDFTVINSNLQMAWTVSEEPSTRTRVTVELRNNRLLAMKSAVARLVEVIQASPSVTSDMLIAAELTVRDRHPTPSPAPTTSPVFRNLVMNGHAATFSLVDADRQTSRAKPPYVIGANCFSAVGEVPPADVKDWKFEGGVSEPTNVEVRFDPTLAPGTKVWLTAFWYSRRAVSGPAANPVSTQIQFGGLIVSNVKLTNTTRRKAA